MRWTEVRCATNTHTLTTHKQHKHTTNSAKYGVELRRCRQRSADFRGTPRANSTKQREGERGRERGKESLLHSPGGLVGGSSEQECPRVVGGAAPHTAAMSIECKG